MNNVFSGQLPRRALANINILGLSQIHPRNPYVVAFWSAMFPGSGHFLLARYLRGYLLFLWEFIINALSHINVALYYSFLGEFGAVKDVINIRWSLMYIPFYLFSVWDSYRSAVDLNNHYILALREDAPVQTLTIKPFGINYIGKCSPFVPSSWCLLTPGLGQLMLHRFIAGGFIISFWVVIVYFSRIFPAIYLTASGNFDAAEKTLDIQWFLNIPSIYFFCPYATYMSAVEQNKLFEWEQGRFLRKNYQAGEFPFPKRFDCGEKRSRMYILSVFEQSISVELAVTALEETGIPKADILASAVEREKRSARFFDSMNNSSQSSEFDLPMIFGVVLSLLGCIYGFILTWGPVIWGVIGGVTGFGIALLYKYARYRCKKNTQLETEVTRLLR